MTPSERLRSQVADSAEIRKTRVELDATIAEYSVSGRLPDISVSSLIMGRRDRPAGRIGSLMAKVADVVYKASVLSGAAAIYGSPVVAGVAYYLTKNTAVSIATAVALPVAFQQTARAALHVFSMEGDLFGRSPESWALARALVNLGSSRSVQAIAFCAAPFMEFDDHQFARPHRILPWNAVSAPWIGIKENLSESFARCDEAIDKESYIKRATVATLVHKQLMILPEEMFREYASKIREVVAKRDAENLRRATASTKERRGWGFASGNR